MHVPSLMAGSMSAGVGFLMVHREVSHRNHLSRWPLAEKFQDAILTQYYQLKSQAPIEPPKDIQQFIPSTTSAKTQWNGALETIRKQLSELGGGGTGGKKE
mmetsp:Transcript_1880/g.2740  ORF Transcript_1880/g.2740 Transcript_1880/m.2740 type:complete len:101 (-) Transcript_1880:87-389(-)